MEAAPKTVEKPAGTPAKAPTKPAIGPPASRAPGSPVGRHAGSPTGRKTAKEAAGAPLRGPAAPEAGSDAAHAGGLSAGERTRLAAVEHRAGRHKTSATTHQTSDEAVADAHGAAKEPQPQADGEALGDHARVLEENPPPDPLIVLKVLRISWAIRAKRPVDEDDLGKAKPKDMAEEAGKEVSGDVKAAAGSVETGYRPVQDRPTGTPSKTETPMPATAGAPPAPDIQAGSAAPDPVRPAQVSLEADKQHVEAKAKDAGLDREEVALIKEGPVAEARDARGDFAKLAVWGPDAVVKGDKELRAAATADFKKSEADALKKLHQARIQKLADAHDRKEGAKSGEEARRQRLGERLKGIYAAAADRVQAKLAPLVSTALKMWDDGIKPLSDNFDHAIGRVDEIIKEHKSHWYNRAVDFVAGLPDWIVERYETAESKFAQGAGALAITISSWVNGVIRDCQKIIGDARKAIAAEIEGLDPELAAWALEQKKEIDKQFDQLAASAETARRDFTKELGKKLTSAVHEKDTKIQQLREMSKGLLQRFTDFVSEFIDDPVRAIVNGLLRILGIPPESFWALVERFGAVIDKIADKPRVFANNLVAAIKLGFQQFKENIVTHLIKGLLTWLTSKLKDAGVQPPPDLSLKSLFTFFLQILGVSWAKIRTKLVKYIGEQNMKRIELAVQLIGTFISEGWDGLWKLVKDKLDPQMIVDAVMQAVRTYIIESVVVQAIKSVIALFNPVGAVLKALELIYKAVTWILDNAARIFTFIEAIVAGVGNILAGAIGGAASLIENALAILLPAVIDLFAKLLSLGDLPEKVKGIIGRLHAVVDAAIDKVIAWIAAKVGIGKEEDKKKEGVIGIEVAVPAPDEAHKLYFERHGDTPVLMIASKPQTVPQRLGEFRRRITEIARRDRPATLAKIDEASGLAGHTKAIADQLVKDFRDTPDRADADERRVESDEEKLGRLLSEIYKAFGEKPKPSVIWSSELGRMDSQFDRETIAEVDAVEHRDKILVMQDWGQVHTWLLSRPLYSHPLSGRLNEMFWEKLADGSEEIRKGRPHFTDPCCFGALEKAHLTASVDGGREPAIKRGLLRSAFEGGVPAVKGDVKSYLEALESSSISNETKATSGSAPYAKYGAWRGGKLDFAYPKHVSWKDRPRPSFDWHDHHVWPRYLLGENVRTVRMRSPLHLTYYHATIESVLAPAFGFTRTKSASTSAFAASPRKFVADAQALLIQSYSVFQLDHVVVGDFDRFVVDIVWAVKPSHLK